MKNKQIQWRIYVIKRWFVIQLNRMRVNFGLKVNGSSVKPILPIQYKKYIRSIKYLLIVISLFSTFLTFNSLVITFIFGLVVFLLTNLFENIIFRHPYAFIHPFPDFDLDPEKWVGCGFGYVQTTEVHIPVVSMVVTDFEYAEKLKGLFLSWSEGKLHDEDKSVQVRIIVVSQSEYIFFIYPNNQRSAAKRFFQSAKDKLKNKSLTDEVGEMHVCLTLGKKCHIGPGSYFPEFRKRYKSGVPVMFDFILPSYDTNSKTAINTDEHFVFFDFEIQDVKELTRKDFVYEMVERQEKWPGKWQGPEYLNPENQK